MPVEERGDGRERLLRLIAERSVPAIGELQHLAGAAHLLLDGVELRHRAVLVAVALDHQHRAADRRQVFGDVPAPELGIAPDVGPAVDRKSTRLNSSHGYISYAVFCLKKK